MNDLAVIIPVYNAEKYLSAALDSVLREGMSNCHLYLVDDGSKDGSLGICQDYARQYSNITVILQTNAGPSAARNAALAQVQEEFITFLDADDEIAIGSFQDNLAWMAAHPGVDVLFFPVKKVHIDGSTENAVSYDRENILTMNEAWERWCRGDKSLPGYFWGKIYRSELFNGLIVPEHLRFAEDMYLLSDLLAKSRNICLSSHGCYCYFDRENAATQTPWTESKASNIGQAYFHRWEVAIKNHFSDTSTINAWRIALSEVVAERKRFSNLLQAEHRELKQNKPSLWKLFHIGFSLKQISSVFWNLCR